MHQIMIGGGLKWTHTTFKHQKHHKTLQKMKTKQNKSIKNIKNRAKVLRVKRDGGSVTRRNSKERTKKRREPNSLPFSKTKKQRKSTIDYEYIDLERYEDEENHEENDDVEVPNPKVVEINEGVLEEGGNAGADDDSEGNHVVNDVADVVGEVDQDIDSEDYRGNENGQMEQMTSTQLAIDKDDFSFLLSVSFKITINMVLSYQNIQSK